MKQLVIAAFFGLFILSISGFVVLKSGHDKPANPNEDEGYWVGKQAPELSQGTWINTSPLKLADLRGKVVLVEFWTFECYNCRNTLSTMKSWNKKYAGDSFTIIGVHTPELEQERDISALRENMMKQQIEYPVVTDNDYKTWNAYAQMYWPAMYLIDKKGIIRYVHFGEGNYDITEAMIKKLREEKF